MPATMPIKAYEVLESKFGKEDAMALIDAFEFVIDEGFLRGQDKVKEDLTKQLATKADIGETNREIEFLRKETKIEIEKLRFEMKTEIENIRKEIKTEIENLRKEMKTEIENLRLETKTEIEKLRLEMKAEISDCKTEIIKWVAAMLVAQAAAISALVKLL